MAFNPGVSFFIPFYELDPSNQSKCIFFTQKGKRCTWTCQVSDNKQAIDLRETIDASETVSLDLLQEYILCNCCRSGRARHRDRIEDVDLLLPLAQRWQAEIQKQAIPFPSTPSRNTTRNNSTTPCRNRIPSDTTSPSQTPAVFILDSSNQPNAELSLDINGTPLKPVASVSSDLNSSLGSSNTIDFALKSFASQPHYDLRTRSVTTTTDSTLTQSNSISQTTVSEFRPHIVDPLPSDSVSSNILDILRSRDFETGSVYIFNRNSSPGHVKIGWTANSVSRRLEDWSKCGYKPNLLFSVDLVSHAQRVETLTHNELMKEWRRERMCKAPWCRKSHQEWFETSEERATQVLSNWVDFMMKVDPYDLKGYLKPRWKEVIEKMVENGEVISAKRLLEHYETSLANGAKLVKEPVDLAGVTRLKEEVEFEYGLKLRDSFAPKKAVLHAGPQLIIEPMLAKPTPLLKTEHSSEQIQLMTVSINKIQKQPESNILFGRHSIQKTEFLFKIEPLPRIELHIKAEPDYKPEPWSKTDLSFTANFLSKTERVRRKEPIHEDVLKPEGPLIKNRIPPEQIPLPPSPLLQSKIFPSDIISTLNKTPNSDTGPETNEAIEVITRLDANTSIVDPGEDIPLSYQYEVFRSFETKEKNR